MNMKTSPNDVSNQEILEELRKFTAFSGNRMDQVDERMSNLERSNHEILEVMTAFASSVDERFASVDERFDCLESSFDDLTREQGRTRAVMVTKGYLDDKLANFHSDIIQHTKKEILKALN